MLFLKAMPEGAVLSFPLCFFDSKQSVVCLYGAMLHNTMKHDNAKVNPLCLTSECQNRAPLERVHAIRLTHILIIAHDSRC